MDLKYKFNAKEYATLNGISASALRKRRLSGKLDGQYIKKDSKYFYCTSEAYRPNKDEFTVRGSRSKVKRRGIPAHETRYGKNWQLKIANDVKQLARINRSLTENQIAEITPDIIEVAKQRRVDRIKKDNEKAEKFIRKNNYGNFINCSLPGYKDVQTKWRPLFPIEKDEYEKALDEYETNSGIGFARYY